MRVNIIRQSIANVLLFTARVIAFPESRYFMYVFRLILLALFAFIAANNRTNIIRTYTGLRSDVSTYIWYKNLPNDYLLEWEKKSDAVYAKYLEASKPNPPTRRFATTPPVVTARSYIVLDVPSLTVLGSKDPAVALPPASTAKLATALAALRLYRLNETVYVPQFCTQIEGTKAEFLQGQRFMVSDLLKALLVYSSADASCVLSIGKSSYAEFITLMNKVVQDAGLKNSKFTNPVGLDDEEGGNMATAADLAKLGIAAMKNDFVRQAVRMNEFELNDLDGNYSKKLSNTNKLLNEIPGTIGIKTGTTTGAGEVLIYEYSKDNLNLVIVVMGSKDRFQDTKNLLNWAQTSFIWD